MTLHRNTNQQSFCYMPQAQESVSESLEELRSRVKQSSSIASLARKVDMQRAWLSRVLSPKTQQKIKEVEERLEEDF